MIDNGEHDTKIETSSFVPEQSIITYKIYSSIIFRYIFDPLIIVVKPRFVELNASHKTWPNVFSYILTPIYLCRNHQLYQYNKLL